MNLPKQYECKICGVPHPKNVCIETVRITEVGAISATNIEHTCIECLRTVPLRDFTKIENQIHQSVHTFTDFQREPELDVTVKKVIYEGVDVTDTILKWRPEIHEQMAKEYAS